MKIISLIVFSFFLVIAYSQTNNVGYYIDKKGNKVALYEIESKKDSTFYMTPNIYFWDSKGIKKKINAANFKEFKISNAFYKTYEFYKDENKLKRGKLKKGFGQLLVSSDNYTMFYSVSSIQAHKGNPIGTIIILDNNQVLKEKFSFSRGSLNKKLSDLNSIMNRFFPKCANLFNSFYYGLPETTKNIIFTNYIFNQFTPSNCNNE